MADLDFKARFENLHTVCPVRGGSLMYYKRDVDRLVKDMLDQLSRFRWRDYPDERPSKDGMYIVQLLNPHEGDAYLYEEKMYLSGEGYQGFCTELQVVAWCEFPPN